MRDKPVRVLIVDDSETARAALRAALEPELQVVGCAADGKTAAAMLDKLSPDLVTMDVFLRAENGLDVAASIMATRATPIVAVTAADTRDPSLVFRAMQAGVLEVCPKLPAPTHPDYRAHRTRLLRALKTLAGVPVVHRRPQVSPQPRPRQPGGDRGRVEAAGPPRARTAFSLPGRSPATGAHCRSGLLLMGASTGGPPALATVLRGLPLPCPVPIVIVQHMMTGFTAGFASWLGADTGVPTSVVTAPTVIGPGMAYLAPDGRHLVLTEGGCLTSTDAPARSFHRPSIDVLFESALDRGYARATTAVLMTGMGRDGAAGLRALREAGARTLVQSPSSCVVPSMPQQAIACGAAERVEDLETLAACLSCLIGGR